LNWLLGLNPLLGFLPWKAGLGLARSFLFKIIGVKTSLGNLGNLDWFGKRLGYLIYWAKPKERVWKVIGLDYRDLGLRL